MKKNFILFLLLFAGYFSQAQTRYFYAKLEGAQQVPANASTASGVVIISYNIGTNQLGLLGDYKDLTSDALAAHIHGPAGPGANAGVLHAVDHTGGISGTLSSRIVLAEENQTSLLNGQLYINVHNASFPNGEIRGQILPTAEGNSYFLDGRLQGSQQVPPNGSVANGSFTLLLDATNNNVYITGSFTGLADPATMAHLHGAPPHVNGGVIIPVEFSAATSGVIHAIGNISSGNVDAIFTGDAYINIHNATYPGGEIRGQVGRFSRVAFFKAVLQGSQQVPPNGSTAGGTVIVRYNLDTRQLELTGDYQNLSSNIAASHIHNPALPGANADVFITLANTGGTSGVLTGVVTLNSQLQTDLFNGKMYVNVHNATYPGGEIRGQLQATSAGHTQYLLSDLLGSQEVPPNESAGSGSVTVLLDQLTNEVFVTGSFTGLSANATAAHLHRGQAGVNGPVVVPLSVTKETSGTVTGTAVVSPGFADSLTRGFAYVNLHNSQFPGGELRGQLGNLVLPIRLTYFNGYKDRNNVVLIWESSLETDLRQYEIEQQNPLDKSWVKKGMVTATGLANGSKYRLVDLPTVSNGSFVLYRLKMIDRNSSVTYSNSVRINFRQANATLNILSNPVVRGALRYNVSGLTSDKKAEVSIIDFKGRLLHKSVESALSTNEVNISAYAPGMYKLIVRIGDVLLQESFLK